jgi:hypothetical protein
VIVHERPNRRLLGLAAAAVLVVLAGCGGSPSLCESCGDHVASVAADEDVDVDVERTELHVHVHEDGTSRYVVRSVVGPDDVRYLESNPDAYGRLAAELRADHRRGVVTDDDVGDRTDTTPIPGYGESNVSVDLDDRAVVVGFAGPRVGESRRSGVVLVDHLHDRAGQTGLAAPVDRLVVHGPPGSTVTHAPDLATVEDGAVVVADASGDGDRSVRVPPEVLVAFGPDGGPVSQGATRLALFQRVGPDVVETVGVALGPTVLVLAVVLGLLVQAGARGPERTNRWLTVVAAVGTLLVPVAGYLAADDLGVAPLPGVVVGTVVLWGGLALAAVAGTPARLLVAAAVGQRRLETTVEHGGRVLAGAVGLTVAAFAVAGVHRVPALVLGLGGALALAVPFGYAVGRRSRDRWWYLAAIPLALVGGYLPLVPRGPTGALTGLSTLAFGYYGVVLGVVLFFHGYALADGDGADAGVAGLVG